MVFGLGKKRKEEDSPDYIEIDLTQEKSESKVIVKTFVLKVYEDINPILNSLREGYTIAVIDIKQLKSKDVVELKRAISKIKKTIEALEGNIAGFGENVVIATPSFAKITKGEVLEEKQPSKLSDMDRF
jgi:SepF-like predicted cell division protein (DUF552 family)